MPRGAPRAARHLFSGQLFRHLPEAFKNSRASMAAVFAVTRISGRCGDRPAIFRIPGGTHSGQGKRAPPQVGVSFATPPGGRPALGNV